MVQHECRDMLKGHTEQKDKNGHCRQPGKIARLGSGQSWSPRIAMLTRLRVELGGITDGSGYRS